MRALGDGTNPAVSLPRGACRPACHLLFLVLSENSWRLETLDMAHVRLPALSWGEKDGAITDGEQVISRRRRFLPVPGEARQGWWILAEVAKRLGHGGFAWNGPAGIFREHATLSGLGNGDTRRFDISSRRAAGRAPRGRPAPLPHHLRLSRRAGGRYMRGDPRRGLWRRGGRRGHARRHQLRRLPPRDRHAARPCPGGSHGRGESCSGTGLMRHFPAFLDLRGRLVLLLGEGEALEAKEALARAAGAEFRRAARLDRKSVV